MNTDYIQARRAEILDGQRSWDIKFCNCDKDDFMTQYVKPLRYLCGPEQLFDRLSEIEATIDGDVYVVGLEMIGGVNYA